MAVEEIADARERPIWHGGKSAAEKVAGFVLRLARRDAALGRGVTHGVVADGGSTRD